MKLTFLGAAHEVTGSCTLLETGDKKILIDCGMEQGQDIYENCELAVAPGNIDYLFLTHAHIDHSGKIPALSAGGFTGPIYATGATTKLCNIMLLDSAHIQEEEAKWKSRKAQRAGKPPVQPPYTIQDVHNTLTQFVSCDYNKSYSICDTVNIRFIDAGHLLGSSSIEITVTEGNETKKILFSGDIGNVDRPLIRDPQFPEQADIVIMESTYGNRLHGERKDYMTQLTDVIQRTLDRGGNLVIPAFAVGRTQELLYLIQNIKRENRIKNHGNFQVWVDSPLAVEATKIYAGGLMDYYDQDTLNEIAMGINILQFNGLNLSITSQESMMINQDPTPKIILSASGMCEAGRIRHHLKYNLWREDSTVLFVGYQSVGTLGRTLLEGAKMVKIFGEEIAVNAHIEQMDGISGHGDQKILLSWLENIKTPPERVFINHGEDEVCTQFAQLISDTVKIDAVAPYNGAKYDLITGECLEEGNKVRLTKKKAEHGMGMVSAAYEGLLAAIRRLSAVADRNREGANKDINKFSDEVNEIADKWDR